MEETAAAATDPADPAPAAASADPAAASSSSAAPRAQSVQDESRPLMDSARPAVEANEAASAGSAAPLINPAASGQPAASSKSTCCVVCVVLLVALGIVTAVSAGYETSPAFKTEVKKMGLGAPMAFLGGEAKTVIADVGGVFGVGEEVNTTTSTMTTTSFTRSTSTTATFTATTSTTSSATATSSTKTTSTQTRTTSTTMTWTTTGLYPPAPYNCISNSFLGPVKHAHKKGIALDDTTFSLCPQLLTMNWPNTQDNLTSLRLFKAWDASWDAELRQSAWIELRKFVRRQNVKVLYGTLISCNETADDMDWLYVKELMMFIGREHVMALAIGNEVELLHTQKNISDKCVNDIFEGGYFYTKVMHRANDLAAMPGFSDVKLTTVMGGFILGGEPFVNTREARVLDFFTKINADFGRRWAWSFNTYPYFDPHIFMDPGPFHTCSHAMMAAINFAASSMLPTQLRVLRGRIQAVTGRPDDVMWLTETGWSYPRATTLSTVMKHCKEWSTVEALSLYYQAFLEWDLSLGQGVEPVDHAFYFTLRDAVNFGEKENFGLIHGCSSRGCKLKNF